MKDKCTLDNQALIEAVDDWVGKLCKTDGNCWCLSIPVNFNRDPDMLIIELIDRFKKAVKDGD